MIVSDHDVILSFSPYQLNLSETHSTLTVYSGLDYTEYSSLVHVPLRPPSDYYTLSDILANGSSLDGATANILAAIRRVRAVCVCVCVCAWVCVRGCPGGSTGRVLGLQPRGHWFESQSRRKKNITSTTAHQPTSPPICKTGTWSCTGKQSTLAVSHWSLKALVGLRVPTPAVRGTVGAPASSLPGSRRLRSTGT